MAKQVQIDCRTGRRHRSASDLIIDLPKGAALRADKGAAAAHLREDVAEREAWAKIPLKTSQMDPVSFTNHL